MAFFLFPCLEQNWCNNSQLPVDHLLAGSFETAMRVIGIVCLSYLFTEFLPCSAIVNRFICFCVFVSISNLCIQYIILELEYVWVTLNYLLGGGQGDSWSLLTCPAVKWQEVAIPPPHWSDSQIPPCGGGGIELDNEKIVI